MKFIFFFLLLVISHYTASSQLNVIESRIVNPDQKPIEYATVILQDSQVKYIDGTITDSTGYFIIKHLPAGNYRLIIQHLLYESDTLYIQANMQIQPVITLIPRQYTLNEVQVSAEGPMMKVSGNMLSYNAQSIEKNKAITTAYEMLKEIPGIFEINNQLSLIGSEKLNIVINGQMTKMTIEQVSNMLKTIPSSNIANIEVMYNPPAKYNVRGALINIVLNKRTDEQPSVTGEVSASYKQSVYASNVDRINLVYNNSKFKVDFSATVNTGKSWDKNKSYSRHSLKDKIVKINEFINSRNNYLDIDYDLSKVMFIATANNLNTISQPLLDRMELIEVSGYIMEEKVEIAARHLVPKQLEIHGLSKGKVKFPKKTLQAIIESYTRESGVRELDKKIAKIMRKLARKLASDEELPAQIRPEDLHDYLGAVEYTRDKYQGNDYAGVVTGLAWTAVGGEILFVESSLSKGKGSKLTLTGNLGDVMKESAMLALEYIHSHAGLFGIDEGMFENWNVHIHVPEGAIPKDGPSAGITMVTSLVSAFTQRKVRSNLAMTGEITLRGKVLPVGGIKEKILAAKRAGIKELILCQENKKDIEEIKPDYLKGLTFHYVDDIRQVVDLALLKEKVANPLF